MSNSLISNEKECFICQSPYVERHHIFTGPFRKKAEQDGMWCYLCVRHHREGPLAFHNNKDVRKWLQQLAQSRFEEELGSREQFMARYGKNHL